MKVLVTGSAGFIGFFLTKELLDRGVEVVGLDNINDYYDINLKYGRLAECGIDRGDVSWKKAVQSKTYENYRFLQLHLEDKEALMALFRNERFDIVVHLAAQAGVRYSINHPDAYVQSNVVGFLNILEACRHTPVKHLVYASSSSVYGLNETIPYSVNQPADHPVSLYAATKRANELMAHSYSHLYQIPTTGLRFFTVYGPWGRPDMALFLFANAIVHHKPIAVFNGGKLKRDFTYIDDIVAGITRVMDQPAAPCSHWDGRHPVPGCSPAPYCLYNIGNNSPVDLLSFIKELENCLGQKAILELKEMQPGDMLATWADVDDLIRDFNYKPQTSLQTGLKRFTDWYLDYYFVSLPLQVNRK